MRHHSTCSFPGCNKTLRAKGLCSGHYAQQKSGRTLAPLLLVPLPPSSTTHGHSKGARHSKVYSAWHQLKSRCLNPRNPRFKNYGGRGIKVCQRWQESFEAFLEDVGEPPSPKHSIDRFPDNDGNYEPGNCRWATAKEQGNNKRGNRIVAFKVRKQTLSQWCDELGLKFNTVLFRLLRGWSAERALSERIVKRNGNKRRSGS